MRSGSKVLPWMLGALSGLGIAATLSVIMATSAWIENPDGIFHGAAGTNWSFVGETAWSWFAPTALPCMACTIASRFLWLRFGSG
jgi:hypothetical protein